MIIATRRITGDQLGTTRLARGCTEHVDVNMQPRHIPCWTCANAVVPTQRRGHIQSMDVPSAALWVTT